MYIIYYLCIIQIQN